MFVLDADMENGTTMGIVYTCNPKQMADILEMTISSTFSSMKLFIVWFKFHRGQQWFTEWLGALWQEAISPNIDDKETMLTKI